VVPSGVYDSGVAGTPHYFMVLTNGSAGGLTGSVDFAYQDGQTSVIFTFEGTVQGAEATLTPVSVPQNGGGAQQDASTIPSAMPLTLGGPFPGGYAVALGECASYLRFIQSMGQCNFVYSPTGSP
jgi:hypothetical protein